MSVLHFEDTRFGFIAKLVALQFTMPSTCGGDGGRSVKKRRIATSEPRGDEGDLLPSGRVFLSKERPAVLKLFAQGKKAADSRRLTNKWGAGGCDVVLVPGTNDYRTAFLGAMHKYALALGFEEGPLPPRRGALESFLKDEGRDAPAGVIVSLGAPRRYAEWKRLPVLSVKGHSEREGNFVYPVLKTRVLRLLPRGMPLAPPQNKREIRDAELLRALYQSAESVESLATPRLLEITEGPELR